MVQQLDFKGSEHGECLTSDGLHAASQVRATTQTTALRAEEGPAALSSWE